MVERKKTNNLSDIEDILRKVKGVDNLQFRDFMDNMDEVNKYCIELINYLYLHYDTNSLYKINKHQFNHVRQKVNKNLKQSKIPRKSQLIYGFRKMLADNKLSLEIYNILEKFMITKEMRSLSGIIEVAIMTSPGNFSCDYDCYYCPNQPGMPRSYIKEEPAVRRAAANDFDTVKQMYDRLTTYSLNGHPIDKLEIIVLGGTWSSYPKDYQGTFIRDLYYASNTFFDSNSNKRERKTLIDEKKINETALCKIIGLTLETRPDSITPDEISWFLKYGVTRVQLGIQHTDDTILKKINRGCYNQDSKNAIRLLKDAGFKIMIHIMPNLPFSSPDKDSDMFIEILQDEDLQADEWKIYPTSVTTTSDKDDTKVNTIIEKWYNDGKYVPYSESELMEVIKYVKAAIHPYIRISRIFRDIPKPNIVGGASIPHMRQVLQKEMAEDGLFCSCVRCCEVKDKVVEIDDIELVERTYRGSGGQEIFLSFESLEVNNQSKRTIHAFLRLRLSSNTFRKSLQNTALVRELHVYGKLIPTYLSKIETNNQHHGLGGRLLKRAEEIARREKFNKLAIISGVGVREYYRKKGYYLNDSYMMKNLNNDNLFQNVYLMTILSLFLSLVLTLVLTIAASISIEIITRFSY